MARILVIDDEHNIRLMVRLALQHVGHMVDTASDGPEGLVKYGAGSDWDLVLLDQRMPGMEGLEVMRFIRARDPAAKVIIITAFGTIDLAVEAMKEGATDFLRKPFTAEVLRGAVSASLARQPEELPTDVGSPMPVTYSITTLNGYRIESVPGTGTRVDGDIRNDYTVRSPVGEARECSVVLTAYVAELVKAEAGLDMMPGGDRFWQALSEEVLANYLWQNASAPGSGNIRVEELTSGLRRWVRAVVAANR